MTGSPSLLTQVAYRLAVYERGYHNHGFGLVVGVREGSDGYFCFDFAATDRNWEYHYSCAPSEFTTDKYFLPSMLRGIFNLYYRAPKVEKIRGTAHDLVIFDEYSTLMKAEMYSDTEIAELAEIEAEIEALPEPGVDSVIVAINNMLISSELFITLSQTSLMTIAYVGSAGEHKYQKRSLTAGSELILRSVRRGTRDLLIFSAEPVDGQFYKWVEFNIRDIDKFPTLTETIDYLLTMPLATALEGGFRIENKAPISIKEKYETSDDWGKF